jgi:hypothetical protein
VAEQRLEATTQEDRSARERPASGSSGGAQGAATPAGSGAGVPQGAESEARTATLSQAYSYVEDAVPGRSTTLLIALVGGIVALLALIAREWAR